MSREEGERGRGRGGIEGLSILQPSFLPSKSLLPRSCEGGDGKDGFYQTYFPM